MGMRKGLIFTAHRNIYNKDLQPLYSAIQVSPLRAQSGVEKFQQLQNQA